MVDLRDAVLFDLALDLVDIGDVEDLVSEMCVSPLA